MLSSQQSAFRPVTRWTDFIFIELIFYLLTIFISKDMNCHQCLLFFSLLLFTTVTFVQVCCFSFIFLNQFFLIYKHFVCYEAISHSYLSRLDLKSFGMIDSLLFFIFTPRSKRLAGKKREKNKSFS